MTTSPSALAATIATLRRELSEAFHGRAHLYRLLLVALDEAMGPEAADRLMDTVLAQRGREVAATLFRGLPPDPVTIGERFLSVSPDGGQLYPHSRCDPAGGFGVTVHRCPLQEAWRGAGLDGAELARLCRLAGAFDRGLFEAAGVTFSNETWAPGRSGCCTIRLHARAAGAP